jgi:hypothetical protein
MGAEFQYDVFLSHSAKDKAGLQPPAERLRKDRLRVWPVAQQRPRKGGFGEWVLRHDGRIPAKIAPPSLRGYGGTGEGLKRSQFGLRLSGFLRPSAFALRIWASPNRP